MTNKEAAAIIERIRYYMEDGECWAPTEFEAMDRAIESLNRQDIHDINVSDMIYRQMAIDALGAEPLAISEYEDGLHTMWIDAKEAIEQLPPVQPEYEPVKTEDFAKTMSENTLYSFMAWYGEALELMGRQGFVICKKTM